MDRRWVVTAASVCVAVPSAVAAVRAVHWGWVPVSDQATIATRAADVLTGRTPRLGQLSGASAEVGLPTRSFGPMGYWPFAVTSRWGPLWGSAVLAAGLSGAAMVASVRLAARRGGPALALAVALGLVLSARAINPANLASTWNPALGVMPLVLLVLLAWSIGVGETGLLPIAVVVVSFCAQAHTALAVAGLPVLVIGAVAGLAPGARRVVSSLRARERWRPGRTARTVGLSAAIAALCWALPVLEQVTGDPGNMTRLSRAGGDPSPWPSALRAVVDIVGVVPAFLHGDRAPEHHALGILLTPSAPPSVVTAVLVVVALVGLAARGIRARRRDLAVPALLALALLADTLVVARATPVDSFLVLTYALWWTVPAGMVAWVVAGWGIARETGWGAALTRRVDGRLVTAGVVAVCAVMVGVGVLAPAEPEPEEPIHAEARAVGDAVVEHVEPGRRYVVSGQGLAGERLVASTAYRIRRAGARPVVPGNDGIGAGPRYAPKGRRCAAVVVLVSGGGEPPEGAEIIEELRLPDRDGSSAAVVVAIGPDEGAPSC